jgi:hypothetical protein
MRNLDSRCRPPYTQSQTSYRVGWVLPAPPGVKGKSGAPSATFAARQRRRGPATVTGSRSTYRHWETGKARSGNDPEPGNLPIRSRTETFG